MGYDESPEMVRVDIFKPSGKWYTTISVRWSIYTKEQEWDLHKIFRDVLEKDKRYKLDKDWMAICLEPYHELAHPIMIKGV